TLLQSTQLGSSSSTVSETNERYLSQQIRTTQVTVNLTDCMQCYVLIPRCTFQQQACDGNINANKDVVQQVEEFREEQEQSSPKQNNIGRIETVQQKADTIIQDSDCYLNQEDEMVSLLIVDLPWSQTSQYNCANDVHPGTI
ncbi:unnamed protein product, partial [Rotaria sp. Silwood2]